MLNQVYHSIPDSVVEGSIRCCGYAGGDPTDIMNDLLCEGATPRGGMTRDQQYDVHAYLDFQKRTGFHEPDEPGVESAEESEKESEWEESENEGEEGK